MKRKSLTLPLTVLVLLAASSAQASKRTKLPAPVADSNYYADGAPSQAKVELGRMLFFDKVLSGNRNVSCGSCHHPTLGSGDALSLPLGEGGAGLGRARIAPNGASAVHGRVPRNSPPLFNVGAREFSRMFHDGRVETDPLHHYEGGFITPAKWKLPSGLDSVLAAQAMFPPTSPEEMAGQRGENSVANAVALNNLAGPGGAWEILAKRLASNDEYVELFQEAYPDAVRVPTDITMVLAANAIAAFETVAFRSDQSPFDAYLRGDKRALSRQARRGMRLFYGGAACASCHSGSFQTDHDFHAIAMPQVGPGKSDGSDGSYWRASGLKAFVEDFGRGRVTVRPEDNFKFRTPSLRNVAMTGPWGHAGAYTSLEAVVRHHLDPVGALESYKPTTALLPALRAVAETTASGSRVSQRTLSAEGVAAFALRDSWVQMQPHLRNRIAAANELAPRTLSDRDVDDLLAFLEALTDPNAGRRTDLVPARVPSGLPVED